MNGSGRRSQTRSVNVAISIRKAHRADSSSITGGYSTNTIRRIGERLTLVRLMYFSIF